MSAAENLRFTQEVQQLQFFPAGVCFEGKYPPGCCVSISIKIIEVTQNAFLFKLDVNRQIFVCDVVKK